MQSTRQLTVQCTSCTAKHGTPPYVDLPCATTPSATFQPASHATHCPRCGHTRPTRPYDYADTLCHEYSITRQQAIAALQTYNELRQTDNVRHTYTYTAQYTRGLASSPTTQVKAGSSVQVNELATGGPKAIAMAKASNSIFDYLTARGIRPMLLRSYIAPLDCTCKACGGQFTLLRGLVETVAQPPIYCVWCGTRNSLIIDPTQTEDTAWLVLAQNYNLPIPALRVLYSQWSTPANIAKYPAFASYMQSEEVQQLLPLLQQAAPAAS